jgi:hypothetical protein
VASWLFLRRLARSLDRLEARLADQNVILLRIADTLAPLPPATARETVKADTGVDFADEAAIALALDYTLRTQRDTGHTPDDEEIAIYLADEKTRDLAARLRAREGELARLEESRA